MMRTRIDVVALLALLGLARTMAGAAPVRPQGPCDIYSAAGTPCVAAHSTTRALYASYNGPLYQVKRRPDDKTLDIGIVASGYPNITIDSGAMQETAVVVSATGGRGGARITVAAPLKFGHAAGAQISGSGITLTTALTRAHAGGAQIATGAPTPGAPNQVHGK